VRDVSEMGFLQLAKSLAMLPIFQLLGRRRNVCLFDTAMYDCHSIGSHSPKASSPSSWSHTTPTHIQIQRPVAALSLNLVYPCATFDFLFGACPSSSALARF